jgi:predicted AAA+ superfamily ATPase
MNADIYITGSNSKLLDTDFSTLLGGRIISTIMYPLSFREFVDFRSKRGITPGGEPGALSVLHNQAPEIADYIAFGGFPAVAIYDYPLKEARRSVSEIHTTALFKDVIKRNNVKNSQLMDKIVAFVYDNVGSLISIASVSNYLKSQGRKGTDVETIANYLKYLEEGFIIRRAQRYDVKGKRLLETNDKYYLTDHSLQYVIRDYRSDKIHAVLENIVYMELIRRGYNVYVGKFDTREIDFVAEKNKERIYIQVCLEFTTKETYTREFAPLKEIKDNYPKYVVSLDRFADRNDEGVIGLSLKDFLLKENY